MSASASEIEKAESRDRSRLPRQYTEEYRLEAVEYYRKAREADPKKSIRDVKVNPGSTDRDCGGDPGPNPSYAASRPKSLRYCMGLLQSRSPFILTSLYHLR